MTDSVGPVGKVGWRGVHARIIRENRGSHALVFTGTYDHTIDAKNRLAVPAEMRHIFRSGTIQEDEDSGRKKGDAQASQKQPVYLYVTLGDEQTLRLYTEKDFERRAEELNHSELEADELLDYERLFFGLARRLELDKQGRIRLPEKIREMARLDSEVVLIGVKDHLEVRDRRAWQQQLDELLAQRPRIMNPRGAMK